MTEQELSIAIEQLLVAANPRGMKSLRDALVPGYYLRAARFLFGARGSVLIGTGFPVEDTFETDGPVGTMALYHCLESLGAEPTIVCGAPLAQALMYDYRVFEIAVAGPDPARESRALLDRLQPQAVISIERPGLAERGGYFNMRGEDISARCACFDYVMELADCPTIAIGDGGNEIGMGKVSSALEQLNIVPSCTSCDELLIADVSNWGAYGVIAILGYWQQQDLLAKITPQELLAYLSAKGSVDGVTRQNTLTEDGLPLGSGEQIIKQLRALTGFGEAA
jgi:hypothetical protein